MKSYSETDAFPPKALRLHKAATGFVAAIPDEIGANVRCHELARAVAKWLQPQLAPEDKLRVVDGTFGVGIQHSWIEAIIPTAKWEPLVRLDVYAPGLHPQVVLVFSHFAVDAAVVYSEGEPRTDIDAEMVDRLCALAPAGELPL